MFSEHASNIIMYPYSNKGQVILLVVMITPTPLSNSKLDSKGGVSQADVVLDNAGYLQVGLQ